MKKYYITLALSLVLVIPMLAQLGKMPGFTPKKLWRLNNVHLNVGLDWAEYETMSMEHINTLSKNPESLKRDVQTMTEEVSTTTGGLVLFAGFSLSPLNRSTGTYRNNQELRLSAAIYSPREAMVSYKNEVMDTSIVYCNIHGEVALDGAYLFSGKLGRQFSWFVGAGLNAGVSFDNQTMVIAGKYFEPGTHPSNQESLEINRESYEAKRVVNIRAYIPAGIRYHCSEYFSIGFEIRTGGGCQMVDGEETNHMESTGSFLLGASYNIGG